MPLPSPPPAPNSETQPTPDPPVSVTVTDDGAESLDWAISSVVVTTRWFGILVGTVLMETRSGLNDVTMLRAFLALGAGYALLDTLFHRRRQVFLQRFPLFVSFMEALFIGLLCYYDTGLDSPFRYYYLLSLICCAFRYPRKTAWLTFAFDCFSFLVLALILHQDEIHAYVMIMQIVMLAWVTWASSTLSWLLKTTGVRLRQANHALEAIRADLEKRVAERSAALRASQAKVIHQEKMAAFGLLAAGIAHEVGNPLAAISSLIQMLQRRQPEPYTAERLDLIARQLGRIQRTIRELVDFSRPASTLTVYVRPSDVVEEALGIAKYYHRTKEREIVTQVPADLPRFKAVRDRITQVVLNLLINAIDATGKGGAIEITARLEDAGLRLVIADNGRGVPLPDREHLFQPYYTTKPQGTGLGLFVSRQILEELGGALTYQPVTPQGARFTAEFPVSCLEPPLPPRPHPPIP